MSFVDDLLIILTDYSGGYKLMRKRIRGYANPYGGKPYKAIKEETLRMTLSRLKKKELVENKNRIWKITPRGEKYIAQRIKAFQDHIEYRRNANKVKNMILAFDIPEEYRKKRDWLREELIVLGFIPLQKSLWFGPSPLPEEFITSLDELNLIRYVKFFKAVQADIV